MFETLTSSLKFVYNGVVLWEWLKLMTSVGEVTDAVITERFVRFTYSLLIPTLVINLGI